MAEKNRTKRGTSSQEPAKFCCGVAMRVQSRGPELALAVRFWSGRGRSFFFWGIIVAVLGEIIVDVEDVTEADHGKVLAAKEILANGIIKV